MLQVPCFGGGAVEQRFLVEMVEVAYNVGFIGGGSFVNPDANWASGYNPINGQPTSQ